jgi:hypothetical protein
MLRAVRKTGIGTSTLKNQFRKMSVSKGSPSSSSESVSKIALEEGAKMVDSLICKLVMKKKLIIFCDFFPFSDSVFMF